MIIEHVVQGSSATTLHNFRLYLDKLKLFITKGTYYQAGDSRFVIENDIAIPLPPSNELTHYDIWLTDNGIQVLSKTENEEFDIVDNPIDRLIWLSVPANETDLNNVDVHFVKVVE